MKETGVDTILIALRMKQVLKKQFNLWMLGYHPSLNESLAN